MRIIGGSLRGRAFDAPPGQHTRPTADRAKVALFNILAGAVRGARVLDGFAGSGALSFESLSRGAAQCLLFERDGAAARLLRSNAEALGLTGVADVRQEDFLTARWLAKELPFALVFLDPPYAAGLLLPALQWVGSGLVAADGIVVAEHSSRDALPDAIGDLVATDRRQYGAVGFTFYRKRGSDGDLDIPGQL